MAAQIDPREEAPRRATEDARTVLAKHPCVTIGGVGYGGEPTDPRAEGDRRRVVHEGEDVHGGQDATGAGGTE